MCICWRKRSPGDMCVYKHDYQAPDRTTLHIQMCLDWPWQVTKRQTSSDSVPFHAPASYYLTAPLTLFPIHSFLQSLFPKRAGTSPILKILSRRNTDLIKHIDVLFSNFSFLFSVSRDRTCSPAYYFMYLSVSNINIYAFKTGTSIYASTHTDTHAHNAATVTSSLYY